jgi:anti-anti-sigma regulatory factor
MGSQRIGQGISTSSRDPGRVNSDATPRSRGPVDFTETVDQRRGSVRARGHLTAQAADLLRGTVMALHGGGHPRVVVDLAGVDEADDAGLATLEAARTAVAADGGSLLLVNHPARAGR